MLNQFYTHKATFKLADVLCPVELYHNPAELWNGFRCPVVSIEDLPAFMAWADSVAPDLFLLRGSSLYHDTNEDGYQFAEAILSTDGRRAVGFDVACGLQWTLAK